MQWRVQAFRAAAWQSLHQSIRGGYQCGVRLVCVTSILRALESAERVGRIFDEHVPPGRLCSVSF